jgi:toxin ParE1/3/4
MPKVLRTTQANADLLEIWLHIAESSRGAADRLLIRIDEKCQMLAKFPEMGQRCEGITRTLRFFTVGNYVIFYQPVEGGIELARVLSGWRDLTNLLEGEG